MTNALLAAFGEAAFSDFANKHWGIAPLHVPGMGAWEQSLFSLAELDKTLRSHELNWPQLRLVRNGVGIQQELYSRRTSPRPGTDHSRSILSSASLQSLLSEGATLILDGVDRTNQSTRSVVSELERRLNARGSANLYLTCGDKSQGFDLHWDDHEVIVLQISGKKRWTLSEPTRKYPIWSDTDEAIRPGSGDPSKQVVEIGPGDFLYVPHGWWHSAEGVGDHSLHITIGLKRPNGADFLSWLSDKMVQDEIVRGPVPTSEDVFGEWAEKILSQFKHHLNEATSENFFAEIGGLENIRPTFSIEKMLSGDIGQTEQLWLSGTRFKLVHNEDSVTLFALSNTWDFPIEAEQALVTLQSGSPTCVDEWTKLGFEEHDVRQILSQLVSKGVLTRSPP